MFQASSGRADLPEIFVLKYCYCPVCSVRRRVPLRRASEQSGVVYSLTKTLAGYYVVQFRLFITKGKAERRGVFRSKGLFASFRGGSTEVV